MAEWRFKRDTAFRKTFFVPESFSHPAKMDAQLLIKIVEDYTKPGEVILDPMAGSGTTMLACTMGRNVILVELEEKFCKMMRDNWEQVRMRPQLGFTMGGCQIIQGDARQLEGILADKIITSPPYAEAHDKDDPDSWGGLGKDRADLADYRWVKSESPGNIDHLPYGDIDKIITSPPYAIPKTAGGLNTKPPKYDHQKSKWQQSRRDPNKPSQVGAREGYGEANGQIANLSYGDIDAVITSPPYEGTREAINKADKSKYQKPDNIMGKRKGTAGGFKASGIAEIENPANIGNLKSQSYLSAMLQVYQQCFAVLKDKGLMILVTKNFIRNKQIVRLDTDTIKLCEQAGFNYLHRHWRKLPAQSFWRTLYMRKHPEVEPIEYEDILVFVKGVLML